MKGSQIGGDIQSSVEMEGVSPGRWRTVRDSADVFNSEGKDGGLRGAPQAVGWWGPRRGRPQGTL